jgi:methionyl-tRNA formyltransferase
MRVVFIGASRFGLRCFDCLFELPQCTVVGAITMPQTFSISYRAQGVTNVLHADIESAAARHGVPCHVMRGVMNDAGMLQVVAAWRPQLFVVVGWYHLLPRNWRDMAPAIGLHASLLPDYAGGAPLVWAMINDEKKTGITLFYLADGVDDGPILGQAEEPILESDTIATLYGRIEERGLGLLGRYVPALARGEARATAQDSSRRRIFPQRSPEDGRIDWSWPARRVFNFVRAQTRPYPGAFAFYRGEKLTLWKVSLVDAGVATLACGDDGLIALEEVEYRGDAMSGERFFRAVGKESGVERLALD